MPDRKNINWADRFGADAEQAPANDNPAAGRNEPAANDADGWQQYRHWISKAPAPRGRRSGIDPSLFSWKGYRDWSDKVKRSWIEEPDSDD